MRRSAKKRSAFLVSALFFTPKIWTSTLAPYLPFDASPTYLRPRVVGTGTAFANAVRPPHAVVAASVDRAPASHRAVDDARRRPARAPPHGCARGRRRVRAPPGAAARPRGRDALPL